MGELRRKTPLKRGGRIKPVNRKRKRKAGARNFGEEAERVRGMPCLACAEVQRRLDGLPMEGLDVVAFETTKRMLESMLGGSASRACHVTARGMGAVKGGRFDIVPLCDHHHSEAGETGTSQRAAFEARYGLDLRAEADRIAREHPAPLGIRGLAQRWVDDNRCANCGEPWSTADGHHFGQMYDGEWVCSAWCEDAHETEGCPYEHTDGRAEQARRRERRTGSDDGVGVRPLDTHETEALLGWVRRRILDLWIEARRPEVNGTFRNWACMRVGRDLLGDGGAGPIDALCETAGWPS